MGDLATHHHAIHRHLTANTQNFVTLKQELCEIVTMGVESWGLSRTKAMAGQPDKKTERAIMLMTGAAGALAVAAALLALNGSTDTDRGVQRHDEAAPAAAKTPEGGGGRDEPPVARSLKSRLSEGLLALALFAFGLGAAYLGIDDVVKFGGQWILATLEDAPWILFLVLVALSATIAGLNQAYLAIGLRRKDRALFCVTLLFAWIVVWSHPR